MIVDGQRWAPKAACGPRHHVEKPRQWRGEGCYALVSALPRPIAESDMIIACPACGTRYALPDSAIGVEGRTVRCAKCKHSWFQEAPEMALSPRPPAPPTLPPAPPPSPPPPPPVVERAAEPADTPEPAISHWHSEDALDEDDEAAALAMQVLRRGSASQTASDAPAWGTPPVESIVPPVFDDDDGEAAAEADDGEFSQFGYSAPFTRRRNSARIWTLAVALFAALATATIVAVNYYGLPDWAPFTRPTFGIGKAGLELNFPAEQNRSETLQNGETIFRVRGTINNAARETLAVPDLLIVFRDERERPVANWVVAPAKRELAPGESLNVTEAIADIPPSAVFAEIGWAPR